MNLCNRPVIVDTSRGYAADDDWRNFPCKDVKITSVETCAVCRGKRFTYALNGVLHLKYGRPAKREVKHGG